MAGGGDAILAHRHAANGGDFRCDLGRGQDPAMAGLGPLAEFHLDHLDLRIGGVFGELRRIKPAIRCPAPEIARANFPHQITTMFAVIGRHATFAGIVKEPARLRALVQCTNGIGRQRPIAHGGDVQKAG